jgi:hypothetical protein
MIDRLRRLMRPWRTATRHPLRADAPRAIRRPTGERLVFVGGAPRSGTTLVQHVLDSHSEVFGGPEFDCVPSMIQAWQGVVAAHDRGRIKVYCSREQIDACFGELIERLLLPVADAHGARLLSEKTPFNALYFCQLLELFPKCRVVNVVRDPRAVVSSMLQVGARYRAKGEAAPDFVQDVNAAIKLTTDSLDTGFRAKRMYGERVLTLVYETFVSQPDATTRQLCDFLGIAFEPKMLAQHAIKHPGQDGLLALDKGNWIDPALGFRPIETSRLTAWEENLNPDQGRAVRDAFRDHPDLAALGYRFE